jgi:hypothetical protein
MVAAMAQVESVVSATERELSAERQQVHAQSHFNSAGYPWITETVQG